MDNVTVESKITPWSEKLNLVTKIITRVKGNAPEGTELDRLARDLRRLPISSLKLLAHNTY